MVLAQESDVSYRVLKESTSSDDICVDLQGLRAQIGVLDRRELPGEVSAETARLIIPQSIDLLAGGFGAEHQLQLASILLPDIDISSMIKSLQGCTLSLTCCEASLLSRVLYALKCPRICG